MMMDPPFEIVGLLGEREREKTDGSCFSCFVICFFN